MNDTLRSQSRERKYAHISKTKRACLSGQRSDLRSLIWVMEHDPGVHPQEWQILSLKSALRRIDQELRWHWSPKGGTSHDTLH
jgi:hypothetical protein